MMSAKQHEILWTAVSKLESQVLANPDLPPVYKTIVADAFAVLRNIKPAKLSKQPLTVVEVEPPLVYTSPRILTAETIETLEKAVAELKDRMQSWGL